MINRGTVPEMATQRIQSPVDDSMNETKSTSRLSLPFLMSASNPQDRIPLCIRQRLAPGLDSLWNTSPAPPWGFLFRQLANATRWDSAGTEPSDKERKQVWDEARPADKGRRGGHVYQFLVTSRCVSNLYLSVPVQSCRARWKVSHQREFRKVPSVWLLASLCDS